jgi:hypothetical protein
MDERPQYGERPGTAMYWARTGAPTRRLGFVVVLAGVLLAMLVGPANSAADPLVTFECTPAPTNCSGWYRADVRIDWTVSPSTATVLAGCVDRTFTTDTTGTNQLCRASDEGTTVTVERIIQVDKTAPVVVGGQPGRGADVNGWYNHAVGITFSGSDLTSGIASCTAPTYGGPDRADASVTGTCVDRAGNTSAPLGYGLKYDATAPVLSGARAERPPNAAGWFNDPVRFDIQAADATSGIADCPSVTYGGPDSAAASFNASCRDLAGNSASRSFALKYDETAPVLSGATPERQPNAAGWFNDSVRFDTQATDATSGIADCPSVTYGGPDSAAATFNATCRDGAGNSASRSFGLKYDETAPAVTGATPERQPNAAGWFNDSVRFDAQGADSTSGIADCPSVTYAGPDSAAASFSATCRDRAGNSANRSFGLKYDETAPVLSGAIPDRQPNAAGWFNRPVRFDPQGNDTTSGIAACPSVTYPGPDSAAASINASCRDDAGNSASRSVALKYDETAPVVTEAVPERQPNAEGWFTRPISFDIEATDALSGIAGCPSLTYDGPDSATASFNASCEDRAGNPGSRSFPLKYDATAPLLSDVKATAGDRRVALSWRAGADTESVEVVRSPGLSSAQATSIFHGLGSSLIDARVENGVRYSYAVSAYDAAGNAASQTAVGVPAAAQTAAVPTAPATQVRLVPTTQPPVPPTPPSRPHLLGPRPGIVVRAGNPPLLRWTPVGGASYYNLQLSRRGRKVLSTWPARPRYQVKRRWDFGGRKWRLLPGKYRWIVWPGFGKRSKADYGRRIGASTFRVVARR